MVKVEETHGMPVGLGKGKDYRCDAAPIVEAIKSDPDFAYHFLYGADAHAGKSIARLRSRIINDIRRSYHVEVDPRDFSTILYEHLWSDGTWAALDSYNYRSTFFQWLGTVASHCIMSHLEENGYVKISRSRTPGNTRLTLNRMTPDYCRIVIDDLIHIEPMHALLAAVYVERLKPEVVRKRFNMDEPMYAQALRAAEKTLKLALINGVHNYDDVLVDRRVRRVLVSSEFLTIIGWTNYTDIESSPLRNVLGVLPDDPDFEEKVIGFLYDFTNAMSWNNEDKYVWQSRFIENMSPVEVAESLPGRSRPWVDTRFSRLNRAFRIAILEWWEDMNR